MSVAAIASSPPLSLQPSVIHPFNATTTTLLPFQETFSEARQATISAKTFSTRSNAATMRQSGVCPAYQLRYLSKYKTKVFRRQFASVDVEQKTADDVYASPCLEEKPLTSIVGNESLTLTPRPSVPSLDEAEGDTNWDGTSAVDSGQVRSESAEATSSSEFSYLKSITRGHWELITSFLHEEPNKERRLELREACTSVISTINSVRFILHNKYRAGERLEAADNEIVQNVLLHHPNVEEKVGCGVDFIKIDCHPEHECRCFFVVRKDGSSIDFSFRKCILELGKQTVGLDITKKLLDFKL
ncbi:hypothetical protein O6H91_18G032000 [Diphasiastrum complanatum]|uniref:Uncharacterized protein n=1 Tax=Diphasiastrum complanatum TaxID=34168 RepID=A0ACC2AZK4_DIPCM|nr:hypothetical protein O6H91_18G032000 [Diphasiastrum complanatum]